MRSKTINDAIYGEHIISEPVIIDLLQSAPMQRLKRISQFGIPDEYYHLKGFNRYVHSVGVMLLLKSLGAPLDEQISGLLHDVSHTAFSHVADWVFGSATTEDYQDKQHLQVISTTEVGPILEHYGYSPAEIADYSIFGLLEQDMPNPCADRVDYSLREFPLDAARRLYPLITAFEGRMVFRTQEAALEFGERFLDRQVHHWGAFEAAVRYRIFSDVLRRALDLKIITSADFMTDDATVMQRVQITDDPEIQRRLAVLRRKSLSGLQAGTEILHKKFRYIDPEFLNGDATLRVSQVSMPFKLKLEVARRENDDGIAMPVLP